MFKYLDFLYLMFMKVHMDYFEKWDPIVAGQFNKNKVKYNEMFKGNFTLSYFGVFESEEEYYGKEIIEGLSTICEATNPKLFSSNIIKKAQKPDWFTNRHFDGDFFKERIPTDVEKVFVCGPPQMLKEIPEALVEGGVKREKIIID